MLLAAPVRAQEEAAGVNGRGGLMRMGGILLFSNNRGPLSFVTLPAKPEGAVDVGEVGGETCQHGVAIPTALNVRATNISGSAGNGGFEKTLAKLKESRPELAGVYDVRVDARIFSVLGFYRRLCTVIHARGFR